VPKLGGTVACGGVVETEGRAPTGTTTESSPLRIARTAYGEKEVVVPCCLRIQTLADAAPRLRGLLGLGFSASEACWV
jgi:hypothetical protein